jgi:ABC-type spermidine/putrescine transport system permease subunit II
VNLDGELLFESGRELLNPSHVIVVRGERVTVPVRGGSRAGSRRQPRNAGLRASASSSTTSRCSSRTRRADGPIHEILGRSDLVSLTATAIALCIGVPLGTSLALGRRRGRRLIATLLNTGMAIPTVVIGLVVALLLWRSGPLGDLGLIYTLRGMIIAQVLIAAPLIAGITIAGL